MVTSKHYSRSCAVQALYQWHYTHQNADEIIREFLDEKHLVQANHHYFKILVTGTITHLNTLDKLFQPYLDREITQLDPVEAAILRVASFELIHCPQVPYRVVINEALEVAKDYGADQSHKYINAILDILVEKTRKSEISPSPDDSFSS